MSKSHRYPPAGRENPPGAPVYLGDMSSCRPSQALSTVEQKNRWCLYPYETCEGLPGKGTLMGAASYVTVPQVTLPLHLTGWHEIYIGFWNPHFSYDGGTSLKVKLNTDPCFFRISEEEPAPSGAAHIREAFFKTADLTGRHLVFSKVRGLFAQKAYIAYVKLVPLGKAAVAALEQERQSGEHRRITASIDGLSYFWDNEYRTRPQLLEQVERYRDSDVGKVIWAVNYGDVTNYPSQVASYYGDETHSVPIKKAPGRNNYIQGVKACKDSLSALLAKRLVPENVIAGHVHGMGLKFEAMFRLAILGGLPAGELPSSSWRTGFVKSHPQFRQVTREGASIQKASYAFPAVRSFMLSIIKEATELFDVDGVTLCFTRGPEFMQYEQPVLDDYRRAYQQRHPVQQAPGQRRLLPVPLATTPPVIDGGLDDACWQTAYQGGPFTTGGGRAPRHVTTFMAAYDSQNLYLAARCQVPDVAKLKMTCSPGRHTLTYRDDCIDLKLSPDNGRTVFQFVVSAGGAYQPLRNGDEQWDTPWSAAAKVGDHEYTVEMAIPFRELGITAFKPGMPFLFNIGRGDQGDGEELSVLAEPYLELTLAPVLVLGTEAECLALPEGQEMALLDRADGRNIPLTDPLMQAVRCGYLTQFVRDVRTLVNEVGRKTGRQLELGVWVDGERDWNLNSGLDVETWIKEGLIDSMVGSVHTMVNANWAENKYLMEVAKAHGCRYLAEITPWQVRHSGKETGAKAAAAYAAGVDGIGVWDMDLSQSFPAWWATGRRLGHVSEMKKPAQSATPLKSVRIKTVSGCDLEKGLLAIYSGG